MLLPFQSMSELIKLCFTHPRHALILFGHWLLHAYGIVALTRMESPTFHASLIALIPFPAIFYILTVSFTDPDNLDTVWRLRMRWFCDVKEDTGGFGAVWCELIYNSLPIKESLSQSKSTCFRKPKLSMIEHGHQMDGWSLCARLYANPQISPVNSWTDPANVFWMRL